MDAALDATFWSSYRLSEIAGVRSPPGGTTFGSFRQKCADTAEIVRIVRYYASEPMVAIGPGEVQGTRKLADHFKKIAERGGQLEEVDKMTTTTGTLELLFKGKVLGKNNGTITDQITVGEDIETEGTEETRNDLKKRQQNEMV